MRNGLTSIVELCPLVIYSAVSCPATGAKMIPILPQPQLRIKPFTDGTGPRMGRLSSVSGRMPVHAVNTDAFSTMGTRCTATSVISSMISCLNPLHPWSSSPYLSKKGNLPRIHGEVETTTQDGNIGAPRCLFPY